MQNLPVLFAYFGPEVQLPLISFIAAASGFLLMLGRAPFRMVKRWYAAVKGRSEPK
jgi:hypothetical protein